MIEYIFDLRLEWSIFYFQYLIAWSAKKWITWKSYGQNKTRDVETF